MLRKTINILLILMLLPFNSSFIYVAAGEYNQGCDRLSSGATTNANCDQLPIIFENNSFEELDIAMPAQGYVITDQDDVPGWDTTSTDGKIEVWNKAFYDKTVGASGNWGITGNQFVEINATQNAALYQDFATEPGQVLKIYLNHGGRSNGDSMNVVVGAPSDNTTPTKPTIGGNNDVVATDIVNKGEWSDVAVEYIVPEGQTTTRIAFVSAGSNHYSGGNFIDNVHVGIDSVYDNSIEIQAAEEGKVSYADSFKIVNHLSYESGAYLGKFKLVIDTANFTNLRNPHIYSASGVELPLENATYEDDTITIVGDYFEEGYVTFEADSKLEGSGSLEISSTLNYLSLMDVALIEAGIKDLDNYYWVKNSAMLEVVSRSPEFIAEDVTINEGSTYTEEELLNMLNVSVFDFEDDKLGLDLSYSHGPVRVNQNTPGVYGIDFSATDSHGNRSHATFPITVADIAPRISLERTAIEIRVGSDLSKYSDEKLISLFGAAASEINQGDLSDQIKVSHNINPAVTGQYNITFNVTDNDGTNAQEVQGDVLVVRTTGEDISGITPELNTRPEIVAGKTSQKISEENPYSDEQLLELFNVVASDSVDDALTVVVDQSHVNYSVPGTYEVSFKVTDSGNLSSTVSVNLTIEDVLPIITEGVSDATIKLGETPTNLELVNLYGIAATEITAGDLNSAISVETNLNEHVTGKYFVVFTVADQEGNEVSTSVGLNVIRNIADDISGIFPGRNTAPKITANTVGVSKEGSTLSHAQLIEVYRVNISDAEDDTASLKLVVDDTEVDYSKPGFYNITFTVTDTENLKSSKTVKHEISDALPVITSERDYVEVELNADVSSTSLIELFGIKATELRKGDLTASVTTNAVSSNKTGLYQVTFLVSDDEGNVAVKVTELKVIRNLNIDGIGILPGRNTAPNINLNDKASTPEATKLTKAQLIELFDVKISDAEDQATDLKLKVDDSQVDYSKPGTYSVVFKVTDSKNLSKEYVASLNVLDLMPVIEVERDLATVTLNSDVSTASLIELFGVSATELTSGDLTKAITATSVKSNVTGTYQVEFTVSDEEGNDVTKAVSLKVIRDPNGGGEGVLPELNTAPKISAIPVAVINEEFKLSDYQLTNLFEVQITDSSDSSENLDVNIDFSKVNISKPGIYPISFSATDSGKLTTTVVTTLIVKDVLPMLKLTESQVNISANQSLSESELISIFGVSASEISNGDLSHKVMIDGAYQNLPIGNHEIKFSVADEEGNIVHEIGMITIYENTIVNPPLKNPAIDKPVNKPTGEEIAAEIIKKSEPINTAIPAVFTGAEPTVNNVINKAPKQETNEFEWVANEDGLKTITSTNVYDQISDNSEVIRQYAQDLALLTAIIVSMIGILLAYKIASNNKV